MLPPGESQQPPPPPPPPAERAVDLLRDLPPELLDKILAGLPARDVVRTSVLSPPWERRWESVAGLDIQLHGVSDDTGARGSVANNFINRFLAGVPVHDDNGGAWWGSAARFLENCAGPVGRVSIRGVPLSVYLRADDWVRAVAGKSPRSLSLALPLPTPLPSLFDCNPARLSELELRCCSIAAPPAGFAGLQRLSKLDLDDVVFTGGNAWAQLEAMISAAAPTLVELRLQNIAFFPNADFGFVVPGGWVIQAPRLRRLVLCLRIRRAGLWELGPLPNLELARIFLNDLAENRDYVKMFTAISNVRELHIGNFRIRRQAAAMNIFHDLLGSFKNLRILRVDGNFNESPTDQLLTLSPSFETIEIKRWY